MKKKISVTYFITEPPDEYYFKCAQKGTELNHAIGDVLDRIRSRLKYDENVSEAEVEVLEEIRSILNEAKVEE